MGSVALLPILRYAKVFLRLGRRAKVDLREDSRIRKSLRPWATYTLRTRTLGWDERNLYVGQVFERGGVVHAEATVRAAILQKGGRVAMDDLMAASGWQGPAPVLPGRVKRWVESELMDA